MFSIVAAWNSLKTYIRIVNVSEISLAIVQKQTVFGVSKNVYKPNNWTHIIFALFSFLQVFQRSIIKVFRLYFELDF